MIFVRMCVWLAGWRSYLAKILQVTVFVSLLVSKKGETMLEMSFLESENCYLEH